MERPKPRNRTVRPLSKKRRSVPSHDLTKDNIERPKRPSLVHRTRPSLTSRQYGHSNPTKIATTLSPSSSNISPNGSRHSMKSIALIQSTSPESKQPTPISDDDMADLDISPSTTNSSNISPNSDHTFTTKEALLQKLNKIEENLSKKSDYDRDLDEIKQFINSQNNTNDDVGSNENNNAIPSSKTSFSTSHSYTKNDTNYRQLTNALPTSLKLIGIRDPKSLLYHRQYMHHMHSPHKGNNHQHQRTQSSVVSPGGNGLVSSSQSTFKKDKYQHLRSFSSIMGQQQYMFTKDDTKEDEKEDVEKKRRSRREQSISYMESVKNRKPSHIFNVNESVIIKQEIEDKPSSEFTAMVKQLASEYNSDSDGDQDEDDDLKKN